jgi:pantoate--beta-alanine ligase
MGALHAGHLQLLTKNSRKSTISVCSIFVNPTQFNDKSDFEKYPITISSDIEKLTDAGCDVLFLPSVEEIYPNGTKNTQPIDFGYLAKTLEGEHRPGHFDGMAQVVERLLRIVKPDILLMGQKDFQQQLIVSELIKKKKLPVKLIVCPTVREADGLAMSSRNVRLNENSKKKALSLSEELSHIKSRIQKLLVKGNSQNTVIAETLKRSMLRIEQNNEAEVEYLELRNATTLEPITNLSKKTKMVVLVAAKIGGVRLIDNMII